MSERRSEVDGRFVGLASGLLLMLRESRERLMDAVFLLEEVARAIVAATAVLATGLSALVVIWLLPMIDRFVPLVGPWDEQGLRRGLVILAALAALGGLGLLVPKHLRELLPSGPLWGTIIVAGMALTLLQYVALGG